MDAYANILRSAERARWTLDEVFPTGARLDFERSFLPESLAHAESMGLDARATRTINQIRGNSYLHLFGLVEEFILPFVLDHVRGLVHGNSDRIRALLGFAEEEAKHIELFRRFADAFEDGFGSPCKVIGPPEAIASAVLAHHPLGVALTILHIEWMTQSHYLHSVRMNGEIEPAFKALLRFHWMEEAQHARLDTLMTYAIAETLDSTERRKGWQDYLAILDLLEGGLMQQVELDIESFRDAGGQLSGEVVERWREVQGRSYREVFLVSGARHPNFRRTIRELVPNADVVEVEARYATRVHAA
jgi:hypothetical protein